MVTILLNAFSPTMLPRGGVVAFKPLDPDTAIKILRESEVVSYIGHEGIAQLLSVLVGREVKANRASYTAKGGDVGIIVIIAFRLPEGKVLSTEELRDLMSKGQIRFYSFAVI